MSTGSLLVGLAIALVTGAYLARPFRHSTSDPDVAIERWAALRGAQANAAYCTRCGHQAGPADRFCAACGQPLEKEGSP